MTSAFELVPVRCYMQGQKYQKEKKEVVPEGDGATPVDSQYEQLLDELPWLLHLDHTHGFVAAAEKAAKKASKSDL